MWTKFKSIFFITAISAILGAGVGALVTISFVIVNLVSEQWLWVAAIFCGSMTGLTALFWAIVRIFIHKDTPEDK
jgi:hypothetical protein